MAEIYDLVRGIAQSLQDSLTVRTVYGEPITAGNITIVPVARVSFGFGGGGGGGGMVQPLGFIEVTSTGARWVPLEPPIAEVALRALSFAAVILPFGGKRGFFMRLLMVVVGQIAAGRISRPNLPSFEGMRFGRGTTGEAI